MTYRKDKLNETWPYNQVFQNGRQPTRKMTWIKGDIKWTQGKTNEDNLKGGQTNRRQTNMKMTKSDDNLRGRQTKRNTT